MLGIGRTGGSEAAGVDRLCGEGPLTHVGPVSCGKVYGRVQQDEETWWTKNLQAAHRLPPPLHPQAYPGTRFSPHAPVWNAPVPTARSDAKRHRIHQIECNQLARAHVHSPSNYQLVTDSGPNPPRTTFPPYTARRCFEPKNSRAPSFHSPLKFA